ncbi:hypothetical protein Hypma_010099 [Hypsizygus marmoreus]|uniref:Uncharacterized protein n=1 Tax=Hypsizygus marmoreus TaxID=39966 RepID=A0A369JNA3_HYPMA|nr:hypothetical protein Hypma_010099 [Hypsizygus marmoreus]
MAEHAQIPLPKFLKLLTSNNVPVQKAMSISGKIYKDYNTAAKLAQLNEVKLVASGVDSKDDRKTLMTALRKSGYIPKDARKKLPDDSVPEDASVAGPSTPTKMTAMQAVTTPPKRKRKRQNDTNELLPAGPVDDEAAAYGSLEFNEVLDEEVLRIKSTIVNRAPIMTAWATVVAERMGFRCEEALSIASVYTEMNAVTKGVSLGLYENGKQKGMEAVPGGSQAYIEFIGRRPLYQTQTQQWRALSEGSPVKPSTAFSYISRAFRQTTPHIIGALKLLADSFSPQEINSMAWSLYAEFRPTVDQWGGRSEVKCSTILDLRKKNAEPAEPPATTAQGIVKVEETGGEDGDVRDDVPPERKKMKPLSLEDYEAALDQDFEYDKLDLNFETSND